MRHGSLIQGFALAGLVSGNAIAASVSVSPSSVVHLTPVEFNPANQIEAVINSVATASSIFAVGWTDHDRNQAWSFNIARDTSLAWKINYNSGRLERPYIVGSTLDGGYWAAGVAFTRDVSKEIQGNPHGWDLLKTVEYEYVRRFDHNGHTSDTVKISPIGNDHFFDCGLELPSGYVFAGWGPAGDKYKGTLSPWIEMVDKTGKRLWDRTFVEQQNRLLIKDLTMGTQNGCGGLHVTPDGKLTWVTKVLTNQLIETPQGRQAVHSPRSNGFWGIFLVQLDALGNEINRSFRQELKFPTLLKHGEGFVLLEYPVHQDQHPPPDAVVPDIVGFQPKIDYGLKAEFLDPSLHETRSWSYKPDDRSSHVETAVETPEGGWLLGTCESANGPSTLMYLNSMGVLSARVSIDFDKSQACDRLAIIQGVNKGEAVVLAFNERSGVRTMIAKYAD